MNPPRLDGSPVYYLYYKYIDTGTCNMAKYLSQNEGCGQDGHLCLEQLDRSDFP